MPVIAIAAGAAVSAVGLSLWRPRAAAWFSLTAALLVTATLCSAWLAGMTVLLDWQWLASTGSRWRLSLDPLGAPMAVFTAGLSALIFWYAAGYLPRHLAREERPLTEQPRFFRQMLAFSFAMLVLLLAQDLLLMFVALELTAVTSFLLIQFDRERAQARKAAFIALLVTAGSSLLFLVGVLLWLDITGSTLLSEVVTHGANAARAERELAALCLVLGVLGKSAQVPLHFWLPKAMVAPTPVSAYLHSAALVAAGVFVLIRLQPLWRPSQSTLALLVVVGALSVTLGSAMALTADGLKRILAYSTIAQYGYMVLLLSLSGEAASAEVLLFMIAHGLCKCALFMTAGAVTTRTGAHRLSETGGLWRPMPALGVASAVACAGLAGLPLTVGYFKDEVFFAAIAEHGWGARLAGAAAAGLTLAYAGRFWRGLFLGHAHSEQAGTHDGLTGAVVLLALVVVAGGIWPAPLEAIFAPAASAGFELGYHADAETTPMALGAWLLGLALLLLMSKLRQGNSLELRLLDSAKLARLFSHSAQQVTGQLHRFEMRLLRAPIRFAMWPAALLLAAALISHQDYNFALHAPVPEQWPLVAALLLSGGAALAALGARSHLQLILLLSFVGFNVALSFALTGAPNVALVVVIVETLLTILFLALLWQLRPEVLRKLRSKSAAVRRSFSWPAAVAFAFAFVAASFALQQQSTSTRALDQVQLSPSAHARDTVTAILSDFRGLDTAGEVTVLAVAVLGACSIAWGRK